jgi:hypothetical protein
VPDSLDSRRAHAGACACGRRMNIDQNFCALNTVNSSQRFFGIILNCRGNIWIIRRQRELNLDLAIVDVYRFYQSE